MQGGHPTVQRAFHDELEKIAVSWYTKLLATGKAGKQALDMGVGAAGKAVRRDWEGANQMLRGAARRGNQALSSGSSLIGSVRNTFSGAPTQSSKGFDTIQNQLRQMRAGASKTKDMAGAAASERQAVLSKGRERLQDALSTVRKNMPQARPAPMAPMGANNVRGFPARPDVSGRAL